MWAIKVQGLTGESVLKSMNLANAGQSDVTEQASGILLATH
jgi:hypothetical protein